jgi:hypothetical protein
MKNLISLKKYPYLQRSKQLQGNTGIKRNNISELFPHQYCDEIIPVKITAFPQKSELRKKHTVEQNCSNNGAKQQRKIK